MILITGKVQVFNKLKEIKSSKTIFKETYYFRKICSKNFLILKKLSGVKRVSLKKILFICIFAVSLVALSMAFTGCSSSGQAAAATTAGAASTAGTNTAASKNEILIEGNSFKPDSLTIKAGDSIKWINKDSYNHTVTAKNGEFESGNLASGAEFSFTFSKEGTFEYICGVHTFMKGTVIVTK